MSEQLTFDRKKGFVALPVDVLEIDLSPGAFRLLVELCRMANPEGFCWPSLSQLSDRFGRSRSAISGYLKELREAELVSTETQTTANGYNYRLKYRVTFWQEWRQSLGTSTPRKSERSVRRNERLNESKNQSLSKSTVSVILPKFDSLLTRWAQAVRGASYPALSRPPTAEIIAETQTAIAMKPSATTDISADMTAALSALWRDLGVATPPETIAEQTRYLRGQGYRVSHLSPLIEAVRRGWADHWRKPPTQAQFEKLIRGAGITPECQQIKLLATYLRRWEKAGRPLRNSAPSGFVPCKDPAAALRAVG